MQHPRNLLDITTDTRNTFSSLPRHVVLLRSPRQWRVFKRIKPLLGVAAIAILLAGGSVSAPAIPLYSRAAEPASTSAAERAELEKELAELEAQIAEHEGTIATLKREGKTLSSEIKTLTSKIDKLTLQIKAVNLSITRLDKEITVKEGDIKVTEGKIDKNRAALSRALQQTYEQSQLNLVEVLLQNPTLTDFLGGMNTLLSVQDNLSEAIHNITILKNELVGEREALALQRADAAELRRYQASQRAAVEGTKEEKDTLLKVTKGKESQYQKILTETKSKAADIRNRIFRLLGGGELPFGEAVKIAQAAERATGVRAAFILSVLTQESAINGVIGSNLGRCYYNTPWDNRAGTVMSNSQKPAFLRIMAALNLDPDATPVSCPIVQDGSYGGATGPAQFMPTTWELYADGVSAITGGNPPSPFNNLDAFTATALLLKDGLTACREIYSTTFSQESCAGAKYYAGGNWRSYIRVGRYGYRVAERAQSFQKDIEVLAQG